MDINIAGFFFFVPTFASYFSATHLSWNEIGDGKTQNKLWHRIQQLNLSMLNTISLQNVIIDNETATGFQTGKINSTSEETENICLDNKWLQFSQLIVLFMFHSNQLLWERIGDVSSCGNFFLEKSHYNQYFYRITTSDVYIVEICCNIGARSTEIDNMNAAYDTCFFENRNIYFFSTVWYTKLLLRSYILDLFTRRWKRIEVRG